MGLKEDIDDESKIALLKSLVNLSKSWETAMTLARKDLVKRLLGLMRVDDLQIKSLSTELVAWICEAKVINEFINVNIGDFTEILGIKMNISFDEQPFRAGFWIGWLILHSDTPLENMLSQAINCIINKLLEPTMKAEAVNMLTWLAQEDSINMNLS